MDDPNEAAIHDIRAQYSERRCTDLQQLLSTMANPIRFRVFCALQARPFSVAALMTITEATASSLSQHLKMMWMAGYITRERRGRSVVYALANPRVADVIEALKAVYPLESYPETVDAAGCV